MDPRGLHHAADVFDVSNIVNGGVENRLERKIAFSLVSLGLDILRKIYFPVSEGGE
jgi:hypothetical protein